MSRQQYRLELAVLVSLDDEKLKDVEDLLKARVNEMLGRMERDDDIRINLLIHCTVEEVA